MAPGGSPPGQRVPVLKLPHLVDGEKAGLQAHLVGLVPGLGVPPQEGVHREAHRGAVGGEIVHAQALLHAGQVGRQRQVHKVAALGLNRRVGQRRAGGGRQVARGQVHGARELGGVGGVELGQLHAAGVVGEGVELGRGVQVGGGALAPGAVPAGQHGVHLLVGELGAPGVLDHPQGHLQARDAPDRALKVQGRAQGVAGRTQALVGAVDADEPVARAELVARHPYRRAALVQRHPAGVHPARVEGVAGVRPAPVGGDEPHREAVEQLVVGRPAERGGAGHVGVGLGEQRGGGVVDHVVAAVGVQRQRAQHPRDHPAAAAHRAQRHGLGARHVAGGAPQVAVVASRGDTPAGQHLGGDRGLPRSGFVHERGRTRRRGGKLTRSPESHEPPCQQPCSPHGGVQSGRFALLCEVFAAL